MATIFLTLEDLIENPTNREQLERTFSHVVVASAREHAVRELTELGDQVDAAIVGVKERVDEAVLSALPRLRVLGSLSVGTDHLDLAALGRRGIQVVNAPGVNAVSVAEHALMMILALAKQTLSAHAAVLAGSERAGLPAKPVEVRGRRVGVLGAGPSARALIPLLEALGTKVSVWTRTPARHSDLPLADLDEIFTASDIISIHLPLTPQTQNMIGAELLRRLPTGAFVVNVARKEIIDTDSLPSVLAQRPDLRFAVDDFGLLADGTVKTLEHRGLWSPHIAGVTAEALSAMVDVLVRGVVRAIDGSA